MLSYLHIENIAVIKKLDIDFSGGFSALTGETGAGKSIIIDGIALLMGARSSRELIRSGEEFCKVSGLFGGLDEETVKALKAYDIEPDEEGVISIMRTIYEDGRTQAKINSQSVQVSVLKAVSSHLINIQSQHESQILLDIANHIRYLDLYADGAGDLSKLKSNYLALYNEYRLHSKRLDELTRESGDRERMRDLYEYQIKDIDALSLSEGEEDRLQERRKKLQNAEKLIKGSEFVYRALSRSGGSLCASDLIDKSVSALEKLSEYASEAGELAEKLNEYKYEIADIGERVRAFVPDDIDNATLELDKIETRLDSISKLKRKYGNSVAEILAFRDRVQKKLDDIDNNDELAEKENKIIKELSLKLNKLALEIHSLRAEAAKKLEDGIMAELEYLDMNGARFKIEIKPESDISKYTKEGADYVEFLIAANPGEELKPMSKTASGGELSRVMLALRSVLLDAGDTKTIIFDEIDTGVSGKTCEKIGRRLKKISKNSQVFCITHSPQVASLAHTHFKISKTEVDGRNETSVKLLDFEERVYEVARIGAGVTVSEKQLEAAREMILAGKAID